MSIVLSKATGGADPVSNSDGSNPISAAITLDGSSSPASVSGSPATPIYVYAVDDTGSIGSYTNITVGISGSDTGITWELSTDNSTFSSSINLSDMDVSSAAQEVQIYARMSALNDGSVATANYATADVSISATENPD